MDAEMYNLSPESQVIVQHKISGPGIVFDKEEIFREMKKQLLLAGPLVSVNLCLCLVLTISIIFVGHLGVLALSGASVASSFASMAGYIFLVRQRGMGSTLETFTGQSYGAKQYRMLGVHLQRGMIVLLALSIPIGIGFSQAAHILNLFRQNSQIAAEAGRYCCFLIPGVFGISLLECHVRFLQAQNNVFPMMISSGISMLLHLPVCWALVFKSGLGSAGAAMATNVSYWINALLLIAYVWFSPSCKETWTGFSKEAWYFIPRFLKLAIRSTAMISLEVCCLEIVVLSSGLLPNPKLETSVLSISFNMYLLLSMIHLALGSAVSTRVSNELGAGRPQAARLAVQVVVIMVLSEGIIAAIIITSGHKVWGNIYSKEKRVVKYVAQMSLLLAASHFLSGIQSVLSGICRGCGRQKIGAFVNLGSYYLVGLPAAIFLAFIHHMGGKGLWIGIIVAQFLQAFSLLIITLCTDWDKEAKNAEDRVKKSTVAVTNASVISQS